MTMLTLFAWFFTAVLFPALRTELAALAQERAQESDSLREERKVLAEVRLSLQTDRSHAAARERLAKLAESLAGRTGAAAEELRAEVAALQHEVRRALGEAGPDAEGLDRVEEAVLVAIEQGDRPFLNELGRRAVPGLARAVREFPDTLPGDFGNDPLVILLNVDPLAADRLVTELAGENGFFWRKRLVRAVQNTNPWSSLFATDRTFLGTGLQAAMERLLDDPDVGNGVLYSLASLSAAGVRSEAFLRSLELALRSRDVREAEAARAAIENHPVEPLLGLFERLLESENEALRVFASNRMRAHPAATALYSRASDSSATVRSNVLVHLEKRPEESWGEPGRNALATLLSDESDRIRGKALNRLERMERVTQATVLGRERTGDGEPREYRREITLRPLPDEIYRGLTRSLPPSERVLLVPILAHLPTPLSLELVTILAGDPSKEAGSPGRQTTSVAGAVVNNLGDFPLREDPGAALHAVDFLLANPVLSPAEKEQVFHEVKMLEETRDGAGALVLWSVAREENDAILKLSLSWPATAALGLDLLVARVVRLGRAAPWHAWGAFEMVTKAAHDPAQHLDPLRIRETYLNFAADQGQPVVLRLAALLYDPDGGEGTRWNEVAGPICADPSWGELNGLDWLGQYLPNATLNLSEEARNHVLLALLQNRHFRGELALAALTRFEAGAPGGSELAATILARWLDETTPRDAVDKVIKAMAEHPALRDDAVLARCVRIPFYAHEAWQTIGKLRDPAFLPLIRAEVEATGSSRSARALLGYLDEEAAEVLLVAAARVESSEVRDQCLAQLEKIREYQDARERWSTRRVREKTRAQVVAELVAQLDAKSDEVRVQAIRALATWEAVEAMPRLIELAASGSKSVAAAAREALDRLNAPKDAPKDD